MVVKKSTLKTFNILFIIIFLLCQKVFLQYNNFHFLSYVDEVLTIFMLFYVISHYKSLSLIICEDKKSKIINYCFVCFMVIGIISSIVYHKVPATGILIDLFSCARFYIMYLFTKLSIKEEKLNFKMKSINALLVFISIITFLVAVVDVAFKVYPRFDSRMGLQSIQLFFIHPSQMSIFCMALISLLLLNADIHPRNKIIVVLLAFVCFCGLRTASLAYLLITGVLFFVLRNRNNSQLSKKLLFGLITIIALYLSIDQFSFYYSNTNLGIRNIMTRDGIAIALKEFPLGYGFGSFGSFVAIDYSSTVYNELGYYSLFNFSSYACDSFVSCAFGQFGLIGGCCLLFILVLWILKALYIKEKYYFIASIGIACYFLISVLASTDIFNPNFLPLVMVYAIIEQENRTGR